MNADGDSAAADEALADVVWWLKGFQAAQPADPMGAGDTTPGELHRAVSSVRDWLRRLSSGRRRTLVFYGSTVAGVQDARVVVTEGEIERLHDALREGAPTDERAMARALTTSLLDALSSETKRADPDTPF